MKIKSLMRTVAAAAVMATASLTASAGIVVLDGWQLITPFLPVGVSSATGIGRLNLVSGSATVQQEINGLGNAFVGAKFVESGVQFSTSYTRENVVGAGDTGSPSPLGLVSFSPFVLYELSITFGPVSGVVTAINPNGSFRYSFTSGVYSITDNVSGFIAGGTIVGLGGIFGSTAIIGGLTGDSTLLATILATAPGVDFRDDTNTSLLPQMSAGIVLFEAVTTNTLTAVSAPGACPFALTGPGVNCVTALVSSGGDAYLVRNIPEPGSIALMGLGLLGLGAIRRRKAAK